MGCHDLNLNPDIHLYNHSDAYLQQITYLLNNLDGPKGIRITTKSHGGLGRMLPGDTLICSASGNPAPAFLWRKLSGSGRPGDLNNEVLVITEDMVGNNTYACVASNILINGAVRSLGKTVIFVVFGKCYVSLLCIIIIYLINVLRHTRNKRNIDNANNLEITIRYEVDIICTPK